MHPILFEIGNFKIHLYGLFIVIGFLFGMPMMVEKGEKLGLDRKNLISICYWSLVFGFIGARLLYVIVSWQDFKDNPLKIFSFGTGGLVFYGGLIGGLVGFLVYSRIHKLPLLTLLDISAAPLTFNQMLGRFGCFSAGCCWGKTCPIDYPLAVTFHDPHALAPLGVPLHPTQLYEAAFLLFQMLFLNWLYKRKSFEGQIAATYLMVYAFGRFIIEFFRGDDIRGFIPNTQFLGGNGLSTSQGIALIAIILGAIMWLTFKNRKRGLV